MRLAPPDGFWRLGFRVLAALLLGWAMLRPGPVLRDNPAPEGKEETPRSHLRGIALVAALLLLTGLGIGGWALLARSEREEVARALTGGDPSRAPALMTRYGCGGCHAIPGVPGADGRVAAPLTGMRERVYVGGVVRNTPQNMMSWIVDPRVLSPRTAMPVTGITATEARDVAAYLYAH